MQQMLRSLRMMRWVHRRASISAASGLPPCARLGRTRALIEPWPV